MVPSDLNLNHYKHTRDDYDPLEIDVFTTSDLNTT